MHTRRSLRAASIASLSVALLATGCGGSGTSAGGGGGPTSAVPSQSADPSLAGLVPSAISSDGVIEVGVDATYAPNEFLAADGKTVEGFDVDLFKAVAEKLGLKATFTSAPFAAIIPGVESGKYEIGVSSFTINDERKKTVDMVSYYSAGTWWATKKGNPANVSQDDACGKHIAVQKDTVQVPDITARDSQCTSAGKPAIAIDQYQGQDQATAAVVSGKDDAMLADSPVIAYAVKQKGGQLEPLGEIYEAAPYGFVVKKGETQFATALSDAVNALIKDGTYMKVLEPWGVGQGAIKQSQVNP
jgi:polar amino acid transport system substrate-binding protein